MRRLLCTLLGMLLISAQLLAQNRTISGKIVDEKNSPISGVSVIIKGTKTGTVTNSEGEFSMSVPQNARALVVSGVGFAEQEITIGSQTSFNLTLRSESQSMENVIVTGYTRERKSQFAGAASVMSSKVVETVPVGSFDQALQGRAPGLQVTSGSGQPGTSATVTIRGVKSLNNAVTSANAQPLYVIDGVPFPALDMATINPNDFESITVLKDASAAALYGARGGLGVIVITTKKGKAGTTNFTYRSQYGFTSPPNTNKFDMMNSREILQYEERLGLAGFTTNTPGWVYSKNNPAYAALPATSPAATPFAASKARYDFILDSIGQINSDWQDILFRKGFSQLQELSASGGNDKTRFFISGSFFDQKGTDLTSRLKRYTARVNMDHTANKLSIIFNNLIGYSRSTYSEGEFQGNTARNSFQMAWRAKPYENPYKPDGSLNFGPNTTLALKQIANVLEGMYNTNSYQNQIKLNSGLTLSYKLLPTLTARNTFGIDVTDDRWQRWIRPSSYIGSLQANGGKGYNAESYKIMSNLINTSSLIWNQRFAQVHDVELGGYFEVVRNWQKALGFQSWNLDPRVDQTSQSAGPFPVAQTQQYGSSAKGGYGIRSIFGTARYTYNGKYTITGNIRRDGTSRIVNDENKEITTYSFGAIWNSMSEEFMKNQNILTDLRVRASYGSVPNIGSISTGSYAIPGALVSVTNYLGAQVPSFGNTNYAGSSISGQAPTTPGNPNLTIETVKKFNFGTDFAVWRNRARFTVDVYHEKTVDLFVANNIPGSAGFGSGASLSINAGSMVNKGIEMQVAVDVVKGRNVDLTIGFNHAINENEITSLGLVNDIPVGTYIHRVGLPFGSHYSTHYLGADPATGRPRFLKEDGTETLDPGQAALLANFGTFMPKHVGGFTADFRFGRLYVSALFSYQFDVVRNNNIENWIRRGVTGYHASVNASRVMLTEQWQKPGDQVYYQSPAYDRGFSSADLQDAKFLRFRNLNVGYNIPEINVGGVRLIKSARFYVQAQNLAIWSPWRGPDPEDNNNISLNEFPNPRMFVTGLDINF
ncbi:MAG TPA: SusC/RagA family TonB-linked outer membrane protein [Flavisolibacter sp.]|nr:SusC/RagA family TonB-linked outer membrane protein [Flavisolibacter sp.]